MTNLELKVAKTLAKSMQEDFEEIVQNIINHTYEPELEAKHHQLFLPNVNAAYYYYIHLNEFSPEDVWDTCEMPGVTEEEFFKVFGLKSFNKESDLWTYMKQLIYDFCDEVKDEYGYLSEE